MKPTEHVLLHPMCVLTLQYKVIFVLLNTLKLLMNLSLQRPRF